MKKLILAAVPLLYLSACTTAAEHAASLPQTQDSKMTAGIVQREIRRGMSQDQVASALGAPNIVSRDSDGRESWIYDKVATEASYSNSRGDAGGLAGVAADVGSVLLLGLGGGSYQSQAGASAQTQRTLTVVIKYDQRQLVDNATFHSSSF